jgi:phosphoglycolate phosphatase-like HAD superfamily hydrolase
VAVSYGYGKVEQNWNYDYLIDSPGELLAFI